jgi:hypothetical protein
VPRRGIEPLPGYYMPTRSKPVVDGITAATPRGNFRIMWHVPDGIVPGSIVVYVEVNFSCDYNDRYGEKGRNVNQQRSYNGQPSVVWSGSLKLGTDPSTVSLFFISRKIRKKETLKKRCGWCTMNH